MFNGIKRRIGNYTLKKQRKEQGCERHFHNFSTAKSVGLLYPYDTATDGDINTFMRFFAEQGIKAQSLAYIPEAVIPQTFVTTVTKRIFCREQLNWFKKPVSGDVDNFIKEPFDILIDFSRTQVYPLQYIATLSAAQMRVGKLTYPGNPYEFILTIPENADNKFFIEQLKHYLLSIQIK
jgi:hypothetical protein